MSVNGDVSTIDNILSGGSGGGGSVGSGSGGSGDVGSGGCGGIGGDIDLPRRSCKSWACVSAASDNTATAKQILIIIITCISSPAKRQAKQ